MEHHDQLVDKLTASYNEYGSVPHSTNSALPSRHAIQQVVEQLLDLIAPGIFRDAPASIAGALRVSRDELIMTINACACPLSKPDIETIVHDFHHYFPELRSVLYHDVIAMFQGDPSANSVEEVMNAYPGFYAIAIYRMAHFLYAHGIRLLPRMMTEFAHQNTGIDIHPGALIGSHFCIDHGTGIVIGQTAEIGDHVKVYQGVTLGALSIQDRHTDAKRHPTLGDHVIVYAGTTILGGDTIIGQHSIIGGNVWITQSVPARSKIYLSSDRTQILKKREDVIL